VRASLNSQRSNGTGNSRVKRAHQASAPLTFKKKSPHVRAHDAAVNPLWAFDHQPQFDLKEEDQWR
jgi:hypothetical protein